MKKGILFLINPISGGRNKQGFPEMVSRYLDLSKFDAEYLVTERVGHAFEVAVRERGKYHIIVAVGGDGTINEVASALEGSPQFLGIVPYGSGNGLARALGIPLNDHEAVRRLNSLHSSRIDSGDLNGSKFFNVAGIGFDAHISALFALEARRGLRGYVKRTFSEITQYKCLHYRLEIDGLLIDREAFMISIANSSQFGNNAHIAPFASLKDGMLDVCIVKPFPLYQFPILGYRMFNRSTHKSPYVEIIKGRNIRILREEKGAIHLDGEPTTMGTELNIHVNPLSLSVLI